MSRHSRSSRTSGTNTGNVPSVFPRDVPSSPRRSDIARPPDHSRMSGCGRFSTATLPARTSPVLGGGHGQDGCRCGGPPPNMGLASTAWMAQQKHAFQQQSDRRQVVLTMASDRTLMALACRLIIVS